MQRMCVLLFILAVQISDGRFIQVGIKHRSDRIISVYDRNCFFSPMGCHFIHGRRGMPFVTPMELREEQHLHQYIDNNEEIADILAQL